MASILAIIDEIITAGPAVYADISALLSPNVPSFTDLQNASANLKALIAAEMAKT
jgi:hypothetical protein